jgi:acetyl-CoA carboxylase biotin carboxyl carrier protein
MSACGGSAVAAGTLPVPSVTAETSAPAPASAPAESPSEPEGTPVPAPLTGTFYRSAGPGKPEFAQDGDTVKSGEPVCIVEAMKLFNPIKATASGRITFLVRHGEAVTKGQTLAVIA